MPVEFRDVGFPLLTVAILSPLAIFCFRYGVPIELIIFGLLCAGFKASRWLRAKSADATSAPASDEPDSPKGLETPRSPNNESDSVPAWRRRTGLAWRPQSQNADAKAKARQASNTPAEPKPKSGIVAALKKTSTLTQWRSLINKFTPEKFEKLCEQLISTLPPPCPEDGETAATNGTASSSDNGTPPAMNDEEFRKNLGELLSLIFDTCSRQHQYTEMYTDLCQRILDAVAKQRPKLDGPEQVWEKVQHIFKTNVLKTPEIPTDLPEDEYMDRKAKVKEKMVGMVKFGGDLVKRGLVPSEGVINWIHSLLSEKTQEVYAADEEEDEATVTETEKNVEQREVQLELLCAILASMGKSLSDPKTWTEENRLIIEDVFEQLAQLSMDAERLSLRIRCLIRDVLDLRMAEWKEKAGKLKPEMLKPRKTDEHGDSGLHSEAPEFVPGGGLWCPDRIFEGKPWLDATLLASLQAVQHHLEVLEDRDSKLQRLKALIQVYHLIQDKQMVIVANKNTFQQVHEMISDSFKEVDVRPLDQNTPEATRTQSLRSFEKGNASLLLMTTDVCARREFGFGKAAAVLINFDFPMTLQLYLYRIQQRANGSTHVYTFFSSSDVRHASALIIVLEGASQKVPDALRKIKESQQSTSKQDGGSSKKDQGPRRSKPGGEACRRRDDEGPRHRHEDRDRESKRWESDSRQRRPEGDSKLGERGGGSEPSAKPSNRRATAGRTADPRA
eukprot:TRINITY_DN31681_c0_g1_i1.p1 TRINITY_DN31681_c0_g1~~TRINITY_DN31681_c0_g1_i1.p1  ORF type:complete len:730 (-),score=151.85 TRINITY_DN31681_c0_g1_i1:746-2935(-)